MKKFKDILEAKTVVEVSLNNEGHPFYTDYIELKPKGPSSRLNIEKKYHKVAKMLQKELPGGSWSVTIDGEEL